MVLICSCVCNALHHVLKIYSIKYIMKCHLIYISHKLFYHNTQSRTSSRLGWVVRDGCLVLGPLKVLFPGIPPCFSTDFVAVVVDCNLICILHVLDIKFKGVSVSKCGLWNIPLCNKYLWWCKLMWQLLWSLRRFAMDAIVEQFNLLVLTEFNPFTFLRANPQVCVHFKGWRNLHRILRDMPIRIKQC